MLEITPILNKNSRKPLYMQLADYIKQEITSGKIGAKEKLPSKRKLASHLELSINTVQTAYGQLGAEGYIESRPRRGLFVTQSLEGLSSATTIAPPLPTGTEQVQENVHIDFNSGKVDKKQRTLLSAIKKYLGDQVKVIGEKSGLHVVLKVRTTMSEETLIRLAMEAGIKVYPLSIYDDTKVSKNVEPKVLLGFGGLSTVDIESGIRSLQGAWNI